MKVLGHSCVSMALVYAQISDQEVLRDYQSVLAPGATIAGPAADGSNPAAARRRGGLAQDQLLQDRTRTRPLPAPAGRGPLRVRPLPDLRQVRHHPGLRPAATGPPGSSSNRRDAADTGWTREAERHRCTAGRIETLLTDLDQPLNDPTDTPEDPLALCARPV